MALDNVFASATNEDTRRGAQAAALDSVLGGSAKEVADALQNIHAASVKARKAIPWTQKLGEDATKLHLDFFAGRPVYDPTETRLEKTFHLNQGSYGRGIAITVRDDGTMKIEQQNMNYKLVGDRVHYIAAVPNTDRKTVYDGPVDAAKAQEEIGKFLSVAMEETARQKLQTALANIKPASGNSPAPRV